MVRKISLERILAERHGDIPADDPKYKNRLARAAYRREWMRNWRKQQAAESGAKND